MDIADRERLVEKREKALAENEARYQAHVERTSAGLIELEQRLAQALVDVDAEKRHRMAHVEGRERTVGKREHDCEANEKTLKRREAALKKAERRHVENVKRDRAALDKDRAALEAEMARREAAFGEGVTMLEAIARAEAELDRREAEIKASDAAHKNRVERDEAALEKARGAFREYMKDKARTLKAWADGLVGEDRVAAIARREAKLAEREAEMELSRKLLANETKAWREAQARAKELIRANSKQRQKARHEIRLLRVERKQRGVKGPPMRLRTGDV